MKLVATILLCASINSLDDSLQDFRKHYGLSFYHHCKNYVRIFKCLTACKSIGFQVFRMDRNCKCTCHIMKTTTPVPFFMWRTNGTTRKVPATFSPQLYHIVGTLSPATDYVEETEVPTENSTVFTCPTLPSGNDTAGNSTSDGNSTSSAGDDAGGNGTAAGGDATGEGDETTLGEETPEAPPE